MQSLRYDGYDVVFQEVPGETTLVFNITGCLHKCPGCHSEYLWDYHGKLLKDDLGKLLNKYDGLITTVCLMGGDQNIDELIETFRYIKSRGLKTCLYTGLDDLDSLGATNMVNLLNTLDYYKTGHFDIVLGGLDSPCSNQKFYARRKYDNEFEECSYKFWKAPYKVD